MGALASASRALGGGGAAVVETEDAIGEKAAVEAEGDEVGPDRGQHQPGGANPLAPSEGEHAPARRADEGDQKPA